ncbi:beta-galactosidase [Paenibacillus ferrarius]|uniref:Beta-galactosidase n=1 Tax=Paenibacillus ferrarius TaxID=1469647 RepID=A0A1V4HDR4_9BACL|nr:glycoside hydrolase family 2 TIM barrel-domain containing protein [Paenibacillus ferrarius]OPH51149.1 beta-galactosidase [Paenibacillus ferrarius]
MRQILNFNTEWWFCPQDEPQSKHKKYKDDHFEEVHIPHTNKLVPHHYFSETDYQFVSWYRRHVEVPADWTGKSLIVEFDGVMSVSEVYVNGAFVGEHEGGYTSFSFEISEWVVCGESNVIAVRVDSTRRPDIPPEGRLVDYMLFGGIYRNVRLIVTNAVYIEWASYEWKDVTAQEASMDGTFRINNRGEAKTLMLHTSLLSPLGKVIEQITTPIMADAGETEVSQMTLHVKNPHLWNIDDPYLYVVRTSLCDTGVDSFVNDDLNTRVGIRSAEFRKDGKFYLNGCPLKLRGLNRHQMFPYLGGAMCERGQRKDADMLKEELGLNFVRSSHYPADPSFLDRCDEIGLLVFEELPGWQYIGDAQWKNKALYQLEEMIVRDRNHPSIFLWGVRINESQDDTEFYLRTNELAHKLDPSRATGGVRALHDSEFLEDVFTYNDFTRNREGKIMQPNHSPYLITEYMGHMYPTKSYDSVERQIKHALGHAHIQNGQYGVPHVAGAAGWCAFDYNTHQDFGSGDRVCYHGVCDIFRLPKFAGHFYRSQQEPSKQPVVFIARYLIPSFNEDFRDVVPVFTNCEEADLFINGVQIASERPDYVNYPSLPHPPIMFTGCSWWEWGSSLLTSLRVVGKIGGIAVAEHELFPMGIPDHLILQADDLELIADGADCTRVVVALQDSKGQTLQLAHHAVSFHIEGPGKLIGENPFSLEAGRGAVYIQATRTPGTIRCIATVKGVMAAELVLRTRALQAQIVPVPQRTKQLT